MTAPEYTSLETKVDSILKEVQDIKEWQAKVDRGIEGEPVHGNPSYIERIINNQEKIKDVYDDAKQAHLRIDKIIYITIGVGAGSGGLAAGLLKALLGI